MVMWRLRKGREGAEGVCRVGEGALRLQVQSRGESEELPMMDEAAAKLLDGHAPPRWVIVTTTQRIAQRDLRRAAHKVGCNMQ